MMRHYHLYFLTVLLTQRIVASSLSSSFSSASSLAALNKITIVGGVHGNEYTGIWCVKCLEQQLQEQRRCDKEHEHEHEDRQQRTSSSSSNHENCYCYPSLQLSTLLANPTAFLTNQRFVDTDLNRQFSQELLESNNDNVRNTVEGTRALEIQQLLGPKCTTTISTTATSSSTRSSTPTRTDCIIDLHSTTANMGVTLMFPKGDVLMGQACAYAMHKFNNDNDDISSKNHDNDRNQNSCCPPKCRILLEGRTSRAQEPFLQSIAPHGLTIEVGPVPQGVIRHDAVQNTQRILGHILDYLQQRQRPQQEQQQQEQSKWKEHDYPDGFVPCFFYKAKIPVRLQIHIFWFLFFRFREMIQKQIIQDVFSALACSLTQLTLCLLSL